MIISFTDDEAIIDADAGDQVSFGPDNWPEDWDLVAAGVPVLFVRDEEDPTRAIAVFHG